MNFIKNINWHEVFSTQFWFALDREQIHPSEKIFLYIGAAMVAVGIAFLLYAWFTKNQFLKTVTYRFARIFITTGLIEGFWYVLREQYVLVLGTKFVAALFFVLGFLFLIGPIRYLVTHYKLDMAKATREASRQEYLNRKR